MLQPLSIFPQNKNLSTIHPNDRKALADNLELSLNEFERLVNSSNYAYNLIKQMGPFYGKEEFKEPTFRITAEPVKLPKGTEKTFIQLGQDLWFLAKSLQKLPVRLKSRLGDNLHYKVPISWRIDAIINKKNEVKVNEIEGKDGASALMSAEQLAYNLQTVNESTAAHFVKTLKSIFPKPPVIKIGLILTDIPNYPYTPNTRRFVSYIEQLSANTIFIDMINEDDLKLNNLKPDWKVYTAVMNEASFLPKQLLDMGINEEQLISAGNHSAFVNKGVFALVFDESLNLFWEQNLGLNRLKRLRKVLIPTHFIKTVKQLRDSKKNGKVAKISWAGTNTALINRSRGVALPIGDLEQSSEERWSLLKSFIKPGYKIISQDFVEPRKLSAYLRKKGVTLERVDWYNRVCIKFVCTSAPNSELTPDVKLVATEVTLGPNIIPSGRECAFTAGKF